MGEFIELNTLATRQHGVVSAAQLIEIGFTERMVARRVSEGLFLRRARGVIQLAGTRSSWEQDVAVAVLAADAVASHRAAGRLWRFRSVDDEVEVSVRFPLNPRVQGAIVHRSRDLEPEDIAMVDGILVTTPERTICDLGLIFPETEVLRILRHALTQKLLLPRDVWKMRQRTSKQGRNGTGVLERVLRALPQDVEFAESGLEIQFMEICERFNIKPPTPQLPVQVGGRRFRLDFAWVNEKVFVEIDGATFHSSPEQIANDGGRQNKLVNAGWLPLRFTAKDLNDRPGECARVVTSALVSVHRNRP